MKISSVQGNPQSGKKIFFQGQGIVREFCNKSGNFGIKHNDKEKSGNLEIITSQGKVWEFLNNSMYGKNIKNLVK